ncbi:MAG TPA: BTAD domain-containing putative transcriptional regulator [Streptosporangiaceae bacterium]|nr:BTAD domain-containing putative transcriptional regulator [Streptosporangiaceae bacterium]
MDGTRIRLLGPVDLLRNGVPDDVPGRSLRTLVAVLSLRIGEVVSRDQLVEALWPGTAPATAVNTMQRHVSSLRGLLTGVASISARPPGYVLSPVPTTSAEATDVRVAERLVAMSRQSPDPVEQAVLLREALGLWRGDALGGVVDSAYLSGQTERLTRLRSEAQRGLVQARIAQGEGADLVGELEDLVAGAPYDEQLHCQLMLALYRAGRQAEALAVARRLREVMAADLGIDPGSAVRELETSILRQDVALTGPVAGRARVPAQLPSTIAGFTGRRHEIAELDARLAKSRDAGSRAAVVISAMSGTAGIGKTALAVQWAHHVADRFPDGQLFANLRGFDPGRPPAEPSAVLRGFLEALGASAGRIPEDLDAQAGLFRSMLADRRVLIVLDNARDSDQVRPLLPGMPGCLAVVTSRNRLASLAALEGARLLPLDLLTPAEARELLVRRLGPDRVQAGDSAVDEIIAACAGLPLALAIVAGRAASRPQLPLAAVAAELRSAASTLDALRGEDTATDLRAVFSWSVDALSPAAARLFRLLGLHPGPDFTAPAAASLAAQSTGQCAAALTELVGAHLVSEQVPGRYALHDLLRAYAAELAELEAEAEQQDARTRMFDHYLQTSHAGALQLGPLMESITLPEPARGIVPEQLLDEDQAMTWFRAEHAVLMATVEDAAAHGFAGHAWRLAWSLDTPLHRAGRWGDEVRVHTVGAESAQAVGESAAAATVTLLLGRGLSELRQWDAAEQAVLEALRLYRERGDARLEAHALIYLGLIALARGQTDQGVAITGQAVQLCREIGEQLGLGAALVNLAEAHYERGEYQYARDLSRQALDAFGQAGDREGAIYSWLTLGAVERDTGETARALHCYDTAARLSREVGNMLKLATALTRLGDVQGIMGHRPAAERSWREALAILTDLDHPDADGLLSRLGDVQVRPATR